ncbi:MAG: hypothetical protein RTU30_00060 [Candidatus Thorarchaeota archaeon]
MIRMKDVETIYENLVPTNEGRLVDPFEDPEHIRLTALNLELAAKNLLIANVATECLVLTADLCNHRLIATPNVDGEITVMVYEL